MCFSPFGYITQPLASTSRPPPIHSTSRHQHHHIGRRLGGDYGHDEWNGRDSRSESYCHFPPKKNKMITERMLLLTSMQALVMAERATRELQRRQPAGHRPSRIILWTFPETLFLRCTTIGNKNRSLIKQFLINHFHPAKPERTEPSSIIVAIKKARENLLSSLLDGWCPPQCRSAGRASG